MQCVSSIILGIGAVDAAAGASPEMRQVLPQGRLKLKLCRSLGNCTVGSYSC